MPEQGVRNLSAVLDELIKAQEGMLRLSQLIHDDFTAEVESMGAIGEMVRTDRGGATAAFENFDETSNQLYDAMAGVMKSMQDMRSAVSRNLL